jgi:UrcA family protein
VSPNLGGQYEEQVGIRSLHPGRLLGRAGRSGNGFEEVSAVVRYGDLDLRSATGVAALNSRVYRAATRLCMQGGLQPVWMIAADRACRDDAIEGAQPQIAAAIASHASGNRLAAGTLSIRAAR